MSDSVDAIFVIGDRDRIEDVDDNACSLLGYSRAELLALHGADLIPVDERPRVAVSLDRMRLGVVEHRQGRLIRKDRTIVEVAVSARSRGDGVLVLTVRPRTDAER